MRYRGQFRQMTTGTVFTVTLNINGDTTSTPTEVTLGAQPFVTNMDGGGGSTLYRPAKYSRATIQIRTGDYLMDLYASGAQQVQVVLASGNTVYWTGYVTPNLYDMGFTYQRETIQVEAIDALSTLQYYRYQRSQTTVVSFLDIINKCLAQANAYTYFYFSTNTQKASTGTAELLSKMYISEQNFFDEKKSDETDEDVAWTCRDVLEEICQYMGVTAVAVGGNVFFIDYDALKAGNYQYYRYTVGSTSSSLVTEGTRHTVAKEEFSGADSSISLDQVYNKVSVKASLYDFDEIVPPLFDTGNLTNVTATDQDGYYMSSHIVSAPHTWQVQVMGSTQAGRYLKLMSTVRGSKYKNYMKYFKNPYYTLHQYNESNNALVESSQDAANYTRSVNKIGAYLIGAGVNKVSEYSQQTQVSFQNYLCFRWKTWDGSDGQGRSDITSADNTVMIESNASNANAFFGGSDAYIIIQGKVRCLADLQNFIPGDVHVQDKAHNNFGSRMWLPAQLKLGNYYWNGSSWQSTACKFKLPFSEADQLDTGDPNDTDGGLDADKFYNRDFNFRNTVNYEDGLDEEGYAISLSGLPLTMARPELKLYNPHHMVKDNLLESVWISGLKLVAAIANPDGDKDTDTKYVNYIQNGSVQEMKGLEFKICTWDNKKPNYSAPAFLNGSTFGYVDKLYNRACQSGEDTWQDFDGNYGTGGLRQEEHLIYRLVNQYSTPSIVLTLPLRGGLKMTDSYDYGLTLLSGKVFVMDQQSIDWKMNKSRVKLVEKK